MRSPPSRRNRKPSVRKQWEIKRGTRNFFSLPYNPNLKLRARENRKSGNLPEVLFWLRVKKRQFKGFDFDRQKVIGNYIVDFYCTNCNVVVEIDGRSHDYKIEYDKRRDAYLESLGLVVIHIPVARVLKDLDGVMEMLWGHPALKLPEEPSQPNDPPRPSGTPPEEG